MSTSGRRQTVKARLLFDEAASPCGTDGISLYAEPTYRRVANAKSHARIIWDACWGGDASFFATASRDKTVRSLTLASADLQGADEPPPCR